MITGVWKGKLGKQRVEIKIIQKGDSLTGTSYYYDPPGNFRRYNIKGYFDAHTNEVVWWDDQLIDERSGRLNLSAPGKVPLSSIADFNCPGGDEMMLDGKTKPRNEPEAITALHLDKTTKATFKDEWDFVLQYYQSGTNDPYIIDSVALVALSNRKMPQAPVAKPAKKTPPPNEGMVSIPSPPTPKPAIPSPPKTIEQKFVARTSKHVMDLPLSGDSIELRFYDNAEIDGDSISLFLNGHLVFEHIRLTGKPYVVKLSVKELKDVNELVMVAENLGRIPPNTAYMAAIIDNQRYEANLESTEETSAMIRLKKPKPNDLR